MEKEERTPTGSSAVHSLFVPNNRSQNRRENGVDRRNTQYAAFIVKIFSLYTTLMYNYAKDLFVYTTLMYTNYANDLFCVPDIDNNQETMTTESDQVCLFT